MILLLNSSYAIIYAIINAIYNTDTPLVIDKTECQKSNELVILMGESCTFAKGNKTIQQSCYLLLFNSFYILSVQLIHFN